MICVSHNTGVPTCTRRPAQRAGCRSRQTPPPSTACSRERTWSQAHAREEAHVSEAAASQVHRQHSLLLLPGVPSSVWGPERQSQDHGRLPLPCSGSKPDRVEGVKACTTGCFRPGLTGSPGPLTACGVAVAVAHTLCSRAEVMSKPFNLPAKPVCK